MYKELIDNFLRLSEFIAFTPEVWTFVCGERQNSESLFNNFFTDLNTSAHW